MENMTLNEAMKYIVAQKGKSVLSDSKMLNAMLNDLAPKDAKTNHFVVQASASHYFDFVAKCRDDQLEDAIEDAADKMKNDYAESVVDRIADSLYAAFSLTRPFKNAPVNSANQDPDPPVIIPVQQPAQQPIIHQQINAPGTGNNAGKIIIGIAVVVAVGLLAVSRISAGRHSASAAESNYETTAVNTSTESAAATETAELDHEAEEEEPVKVAESTEPEYRMGTVYIAPGAEPRRIIVRTEPRKADDTKTDKRKYDGDRVKVYETKQGSKYLWYRIGENEWIAGNGTSFFVKFD